MLRCVLVCACTVLLAVAADECRVWHDVQGRAITAKLVACDSRVATLERKDGLKSSIPLAQLAPADRVLATALVTRAISATRIALTGADGAQVALLMPAPATVPCGILIEDCAPAAAELPLGQPVTLTIRYQFTTPHLGAVHRHAGRCRQHAPGTLAFSFDDIMKIKGTALLSSPRAPVQVEIADMPPLALAYLLALDLQSAAERPVAAGTAAAAPAPAAASLPASFSLRPEYMWLGLDVGDQGRRGSCLIFGVINPLEFQLARHGTKVKLSERFTAWAANTVRGKTAGSEGYSPADVLNSIKQYGYTSERRPCAPRSPRVIQ